MGTLTNLILSSPRRLAMPVLSFPGGALTGAAISDMVTDAARQTAAQLALHERFRTPFLMSAMDLSVEAEEFGSDVSITAEEIPNVTSRLVIDRDGIEELKIPVVGTHRTRVYLETVRRLKQSGKNAPVLGGMIGPFSLAGRLFGVSEALAETMGDEELLTALLEKSTGFLVAYARAFREAGADGLIIAEPTAGLMSPDFTARFSSPYVHRIVKTVEDGRFQVVLHNCGARIGHLQAKLEAGASILHFGKPMDIPVALSKVPSGVILCGNLDPAAVFVGSTPAEVRARTRELLDATAQYRNFVISSGCDIPAQSPIENLEAFFDEVARG